MRFFRLIRSSIVALTLIATGCESTYEAPNQLAVVLGPQWRKYVNKRRQVAMAFIGQSNAMGVGDSLLSPHLPDSTGFEWVFYRRGVSGGDGSFKPLRDPISIHRPSLQRSQTGSSVPATILRYKELTGLSTLVSHVAVSGSFVLPVPSRGNGGWEIGGSYRETFYFQTKLMLEAAGIERLAWVNMIIGESDGANMGHNSMESVPFPNGMIVPGSYDAAHGYPNGYPNPSRVADVYSAYSQFIKEMQDKFPGVKININQTGSWHTLGESGEQGVEAMWLVQEHLARTIPNVFCEMKDAKYFNSYGFLRTDGVHYTQAGLNYMGRVDGEIMATH